MKNVVVSWSSGKDSALTLLRLLDDPDYNVVGLLTTYIREFDSDTCSFNERVPFQETPMEAVRQQAEKIQLPLIEVELPEVFPKNTVYQSLVINGLKKFSPSLDAVAFGDMFCNGIVEYRKSYIELAGWQCVFPLLNQEPLNLAYEIIERGIKTFISCVDTNQCESGILGKEYTQELIEKLPKTIDPCGENGEFHTLVYQAPCFLNPVNIKKTEFDKSTRFHIQNYIVK